MQYNEYQPCSQLKEYINCFWSIEGYTHSSESIPERIIPDGSIELIFHFATPFERTTAEGIKSTQPKFFIAGQFTRFIYLEPKAHVHIIGIRLFPWAARLFLDIPVYELTDKMPNLVEIIGNEIILLAEQLHETKNMNGIISVLETFLLKRININHLDLIVASAIKQITKSKGEVKFDSLISQFNITQRRFEQRFINSIGITPKFFSRVVRFQNFFRQYEKFPSQNFTFLAYECGYYDQAHLIKDFNQFTGVSPRKYFFEKHFISDCFSNSKAISFLY